MLLTQPCLQSSAQKSILYFWQGAEAGPRTWPSFQLSLAPMIDKTITAGGHPAPQRLRLMQGRESAHFLHLFGLRLVVHRGTRPPKGTASSNGLFETRLLPLPPTVRLRRNFIARFACVWLILT